MSATDHFLRWRWRWRSRICRPARSRQASFFFEFGNESCTNNDGIVHVHGALHAEVLPTAYELILLAYPTFRVLTARRVSARSQLEGNLRRYSASKNELSD